MTQIDQFESVFKAAVKEPFHYEAMRLKNVLSVTDLSGAEEESFASTTRRMLAHLSHHEPLRWRTLPPEQSLVIGDLLEAVEEQKPDLICTYRNLHSGAWRWPYSLGDHLAVLTQVTPYPVLILPRPGQGRPYDGKMDSVMVVSAHLSGDHRLINWAIRFTEKGGTLFLSHVEDEEDFFRYSSALGKIPQIETDSAKELIRNRLLKEPTDYIDSCASVLAETNIPITIESLVSMGSPLEEYRALIQEKKVDLLVLHTKDDRQLAMHGLAYPLAVELRQVPILLL